MGVEQRKSAAAHEQGDDKYQPTLLGGTAIKPPERHGWEAIKYLIYDKEKGAFFTRTPKSWLLIFIFYVIFYSCLAGFWYGILMIFFHFVPTDHPKYMTVDSIIGKNPGVGIRPHQPDVTIDSSMLFLKFDAKNEQPSHDFETASNIDWAKRYEKFVVRYQNKTGMRECSGNEPSDVGKEACLFDINTLGECATYPYGYQVTTGNQVEPCILLKLNRIFNWVPEPYDDADLTNEDPENVIPEEVKKLIRESKNQVYLNCVGENPADREVLENNIAYFPKNQGISFKYFPYNQAGKNYHNPVVAVKFSNLPKGQLVHIECKAYYKGVQHSRKERQGLVHFEFILE